MAYRVQLNVSTKEKSLILQSCELTRNPWFGAEVTMHFRFTSKSALTALRRAKKFLRAAGFKKVADELGDR